MFLFGCFIFLNKNKIKLTEVSSKEYVALKHFHSSRDQLQGTLELDSRINQAASRVFGHEKSLFHLKNSERRIIVTIRVCGR